eukprot:g5864.t1
MSLESQDGMTTAAEESQDTPDASLADKQDDQDKKTSAAAAAAAAGKKKKAKEKKPKEKKPKAKLPIFTERDAIVRRETLASGKSFTVLSWNVNGIRATAKKGMETLRGVVKEERPDLVCFQETKIQADDVDDKKHCLRELLPGYDSEWNCSGAKKGYSGTAVFFPNQDGGWYGKGGARGGAGNEGSMSDEPAKKKLKQGKISSFFSATPNQQPAKDATPTPAPAAEPPTSSKEEGSESPLLAGGRSGVRVLGVRFGIGGDAKHNNEGRAITVEYEKFFVVTVYVPNSGEGLVRLKYRTKEWDPQLQSYVKALGKQKPVVVNGDFNVAHLDLDIYNRGAPHLPKNSATTKEERDSFGDWMQNGKVSDAFRRLHPEADGAYTYWSVRTNARPGNKGLRLDYFVCSDSMFEEGDNGKGKGGGKKARADTGVVVHECFILDKATVGLSDHCPIGITLRLP